MIQSARLGAFLSALAAALVAPTSALAQNKPAYAKVYSVRLAANPTATLADLEKIAREKGSIEVIEIPPDGNIYEAKRTIIRLGEKGMGYPWFSVRTQVCLQSRKLRA